MALQLYSDQFWYPTGVLAANVPFQIFPIDSNAFAPLWQDAAGTIPLPNPGSSTDGAGAVTFWAEVGQYWVHLDTETFLIDVGLSEEQADLSTGVASGGDTSPNVGNPLAFDVAQLIGYIVDNTNELSVPPSVARVDFPGGTFVLDGPAQARTITYLLMDASGNIIQQAARPSPVQYRQNLWLAILVFDTGLGQIVEIQTIPTILPQPAAQFVDLCESLEPFSLDGNEVTPNGPNLMINKSAGVLFARGGGYVSGGVVTENPHIIQSPALIGAAMRRILQTASTPTPPPVFTIDPANYDVGGVLTPVPGGPTVSTVQRIYLFAADTASLRIAVQYGQTLYANPAVAVSSITAGNRFMPAPVTHAGSLIGYLAVTKSCTDLSDPAQATFVFARKFATP